MIINLEILILLKLYFFLAIIRSQLTSKFQSFQGYQLDNSTMPFTVPCEAENICIEGCLSDSVCTAVSINYGVPGKCKPGKNSKYGRIFLRKALNWTTWIRSMTL